MNRQTDRWMDKEKNGTDTCSCIFLIFMSLGIIKVHSEVNTWKNTNMKLVMHKVHLLNI